MKVFNHEDEGYHRHHLSSPIPNFNELLGRCLAHRKNSEEGVVERSNQFLPGLLRVTACSLFGGLVGYSFGFFGPEIIGAGQSENTMFALFVMFPLGLVGGAGFGLIRELRDL